MTVDAAQSRIDDGETGRLRRLVFLRLFITTFLLGIAALIQAGGDMAISDESLYLVFTLIGATYFFSVLYLLLERFRVGPALNVSLQAVIDVVLVTALVYATGGVGSIYSLLYPLVIIYGALFLGRRGALLIASLAAIGYGGLLDLEYFGYIQPVYGELYYYSFSAGYVFSRIFIHIVFFYLVAFLAAFVVERERRATTLLTEREDSFRRLDLLHRSIIESVNTGIITIDDDRTVRSFNRAAEEITGIRRFRATGRNLDEVLPGVAELVLRQDEARRVEETAETAEDGRQMILGCSLSPLLDSAMNRIGTIIIFQDVTDMRKLEREIEKSKKMAFLGEMSAVLAHELRNPLASISGSIQLLRRDLALGGADRRLMDIIERGRNQLETLARDFLLLAPPQRSPESAVSLDLAAILDDVEESLRLGGEWGDETVLVRQFESPPILRGHEREVRQALSNLLANALQAMPEGGEITLSTRRASAGDGAGDRYEIDIRDRGRGIDSETLKQVRDPFFTTRSSGTGLGLVIAERVMALHGGSLAIESEPGRGTRVVLTFPLEDGRPERKD